MLILRVWKAGSKKKKEKRQNEIGLKPNENVFNDTVSYNKFCEIVKEIKLWWLKNCRKVEQSFKKFRFKHLNENLYNTWNQNAKTIQKKHHMWEVAISAKKYLRSSH